MNTENTTMTNDCKTCPVSTGTHKPAEAVHQIAEPAAQAPDEAQIKALMRKHCIWIEHSTLLECDEPERELRAVQAEEHQFNAFVQDLIAATQLAEAPQAVQAAVPATNHSETPNSSTIIVPYGWKLVPDDATPEWVTNLEALPDWREAVGECIKRFLAAAPAHPAEGVPATSVYAEARECTHCNHVGINDSAEGLAACKSCQWCGESPKEDKCPSCEAEGTMTASCPKCHNEYSLIASDTIAATQPAAQGLDAQDASVLQYLLSNAKYHEWDGGYRADFDISINADVNGVRAESAKEAVQNILAAQAKQGGADHG